MSTYASRLADADAEDGPVLVEVVCRACQYQEVRATVHRTSHGALLVAPEQIKGEWAAGWHESLVEERGRPLPAAQRTHARGRWLLEVPIVERVDTVRGQGPVYAHDPNTGEVVTKAEPVTYELDDADAPTVWVEAFATPRVVCGRHKRLRVDEGALIDAYSKPRLGKPRRVALPPA